MSHLDTSTIDRLNEAFSVTMTAEAVAMHEAVIAEAIRAPNVAEVQRRSLRWRLRVPAFLTAVAVIAPIGAAVAAESALPGDFLYPVKRITEPIISVFDTDVVAGHRIDELVRIVDSPNEVDRLSGAVDDAKDAVIDLPRGHHLRDDLIAITDRISNLQPDTRTDVSTGNETDRPVDPARDSNTTTSKSDAPPPDHPTTTVAHRDESSDTRPDEPESPTDSPPPRR
jgi:hypothetical protein